MLHGVASAARAKAKSSAAAANHKSPSPKHVAAAEVSDADVPACVGLTGVVWGGDSAALRFAWWGPLAWHPSNHVNLFRPPPSHPLCCRLNPSPRVSTIAAGLCGQCGGSALRSFQDTPCPPPNPQLTIWLLGLRQSSTVLIILLTWLQATGRCGRPCESGAGCRVRGHWPDPSRPQLPPPRQSGA